MKKWIALVMVLCMIPLGLSISADDFFTTLTGMNEDLTSAEMSYVFCNPFETANLYPAKMISNNIYTKTTAKKLPKIKDDVTYLMNFSKPIYGENITKDKDKDKNKTKEIGFNITGYEEAYKVIGNDDYVAPQECVEIVQIVYSEPRYRDVDAVDIVPLLDLKDVDKNLEKNVVIDKDYVEQLKWAWWNIAFLNRTQVYVTNHYSTAFSALPIEFNATLLEAEADGSDIKAICNGNAVEFGVKPYGSSIFGIRMKVAVGSMSTNDKCYLYWNPTEDVDNTSSDWDDMSFNLRYNLTERFYDWEDYIQYYTGWYLTDSFGADAPSGYALYSPAKSSPYPTFKSLVTPNSMEANIILIVNGTNKFSGLSFGENTPSSSPYNSYMVAINPLTPNDRLQIFKYSTGTQSVVAFNNTATNLDRWQKLRITWNPEGRIRAWSYNMNGSLNTFVTGKDSSYVQGYMGFGEDVLTQVAYIDYRQVSNYSVTLRNNESIEAVNKSVGNISNVDVEWGNPTNQYCINANQLKQEWIVVINDKVYSKEKTYLCEYGCKDNECDKSPEAYDMDEFWKYGIFIIFFIALILIYLYMRGR